MKSEAPGSSMAAGEGDGSRVTHAILEFARLLRSCGLTIGPQKAIEAIQAVLAAGLDDPKTFYWTLHAVFVSRPSEREAFAQCFHIVWREPGFVQRLMAAVGPTSKFPLPAPGATLLRAAASPRFEQQTDRAAEREMLDFQARGAASDREAFSEKNFEHMSAEELQLARRAIADLASAMAKIRTRRFRQAQGGVRERLDPRRMLRRAGMKGTGGIQPLYRMRHRRAPPLVVLCDISGSMDLHARLFLHFLYALINEGERVHAFLFGTRLTNVTRMLRDRDAGAAIAKVQASVQDWSGGTRIGESLLSFNQHWARRVLGQNATVLLLTDGLDRSGGKGVAREARRLRSSLRRLIWLNPLLRYEGYAPLAAGAAELHRYASEVRPCHNLKTIADLAAALSSRPVGGRRGGK